VNQHHLASKAAHGHHCGPDAYTNPLIQEQLQEAARTLSTATILGSQRQLDARLAIYQKSQGSIAESGEALFPAGVQ
jgi:hypothetical protein